MTRVIYIAGYGRSGSTVLDTLLGNHPQVFGAGELAFLFAEWLRGGFCSCGEKYSECRFWQEVIGRLYSVVPELNLSEAEQITRRREATLGWVSFHRGARDGLLYHELWGAMMSCISRVSRKGVIVDSSKSSRNCARRIQALTRLPGLDLRVIHLVRDPRAVMWSILRGSNRKLEAGQSAGLPGGVYRALTSWTLANLSVHITAATHPQLEVVRIRYEDLMGNPIQQLHKLAAHLDLEMAPIVDLTASQHPIDPGHGVAGNRARRKGPLRLRFDEEWKAALPRHARRLAALSWPLAHRYGYDVLR